ncbi:MAG: hypothetical protein M3O65_13305, partial [Actinomycetota bacterium]|nr:hypothetical protein [Actinomycetota bacterium]
MITPTGHGGLSALAQHAPVLLEVVFGVYVSLVVILAMVGSMHPDERCRADAQRCWTDCFGRARGAERWWDSR